MPGKKRFGSREEDAKSRVQKALGNAAKRRLGMGENQPGSKFGRVSGNGPAVSDSFAANSKGRFVPRTATGRPAGVSAGSTGPTGVGKNLTSGSGGKKRSFNDS